MAQPHRSAHVQRTMLVLWPFRPPRKAPATQQAHSNSEHGHRDRGKSQAYGDSFFIRSKGFAHSLTKSPSVLKKVVTRGSIPPDAGHRQPVKLQCQVGPHQALCGQKLEVAIHVSRAKEAKDTWHVSLMVQKGRLGRNFCQYASKTIFYCFCFGATLSDVQGFTPGSEGVGGPSEVPRTKSGLAIYKANTLPTFLSSGS